MTTASQVRTDHPRLQAALRLALTFAAIKLALQFALTLWTTHLGYSYFRDEFYYIACGRHLAWGYVDHGPIVALQARLGELLFGDSVFGIRVLSAVAGALTVFLGSILCWALGGERPAQALTGMALLVAPQYLAVDGFLSMNSYEAVFWSLCLLAMVRLWQGRSPAVWWTVFGVSAGIGLLNKPSMLFFLASLAVGLLLSPARRLLTTRWAVAGVVMMIVIALPNVLWQVHHHWPTLEFLHNGRTEGKNVVLGPRAFLLAQINNLHPLNALLWIPGVIALLRGRSIRNLRWLGTTFVVFFAVMYAAHAKDYYLEGIYPAYFAAGAIAWERRFATSSGVRGQRVFAFPYLQAALILTGLILLPMSGPVLRPAAWVRYTSALRLHTPPTENSASGPLPQFFADRFGWDEEVAAVAGAFRSLPREEQKRVCLFGGNYGEAGAIDFLGHRGKYAALDLPPAMSGQNSYWMWGTHGCDPNVVIAVVGDTPEELSRKYVDVTMVAHLTNPWAMPFEHKTVYLVRGRRPSAPFHWRDERFYY